MISKIEGLEETVANLEELSRATQRNTIRRALLQAAQPMADVAAQLAPVERGVLSFSITVATQLTRRHKAEQRDRESEVEVYIGPAGGQGALQYAGFVEFGTIDTQAMPFMRPAFDSMKESTIDGVKSSLAVQVNKSAIRAARKAARFAKI